MWAERDISRLFFNIVPTDTDTFVPPLHELEEPLLVKVVSWVRTAASTSSLVVKLRPRQSREKVEVAGRQVGTVGGVVQALPTEGGNMVDRCCCRVGSRIIQHTRTPVSELLAPSPHHLHRRDFRSIPCLPGTHYSVVMSLTQHWPSPPAR
jgi:hypothetical protein